eukprot:CAMPEP_0174258370 /NCGR_PEP_ID=MMETSP0439-20130205/7367_1 /TAXON_ID=0 /ORGANISM="Stereomyxa ramosa, Strain Chinc5" /LENGTH=662 /DNA_ID=CAMNT_0015341847 /DNA_START=17 /DNA_END=2005 /DNA_ORIENTATION=-
MDKVWESEWLGERGKEKDFEDKSEEMRWLLDSETTLFSSTMRDWLLTDDVCEILIRYITRVPEDIAGIPSPDEPVDSEEFIFSSNQRRDALLADETDLDDYSSSDEEDLQFSVEAKRADKAGEVFNYQAGSFPQHFVDNKLETLVLEIFKIFHVEAKGDFDNFDKIFQSILTPFPSQVLTILIKHKRLVFNLLNYLHDPAVAEAMMCILKTPLPGQYLEKFYNHLREEGFFEFLGRKIYGEGSESSFEDASAFFIRVVEACSIQNNADIMFSELVENTTFLDGLMSCISEKNTKGRKRQQVSCIYSLQTLLLKSGEQLFNTSLEAYAPTPLPNMLTSIRTGLHAHLAQYITVFYEKLIANADMKLSGATKYSAYEVKKKFGLHCVALMEILVDLLQENPKAVLDNVVPGIWRVLSNWTFGHAFNNVYHSLFLKIFTVIIKTNHVASLKGLLGGKCKFLSRMIDHFNTTTTFTSGFRGYIITIGNILRLQSGALPRTDFLVNFLRSHQPWNQFLPILRAETVRQLVTDHPPPQQSNFNPFAHHDTFGLPSYLPNEPPQPITEDDVDIELGSIFAADLGFGDVLPYVSKTPAKSSKAKKRRRRRKNKGKASNGAVNNDKGKENGEVGDKEAGSQGNDDKGKDKGTRNKGPLENGIRQEEVVCSN